jgi:hypothetical protein
MEQNWPAGMEMEKMDRIVSGSTLERSILDAVLEKDEHALNLMRVCVDEVKDRLFVAKRKGLEPGCTDIQSGKRIAWTWQRRFNGAFYQLYMLATIMQSVLVVTASGGGKLSQTAIATAMPIIREYMQFLSHDPELQFEMPFPYDQAAMRMAYEEFVAKDAK